MWQFLEGIGQFLESVFAFIENFIQSLLDLFIWVGKALSYIANLSPYIPASLLGIAMVFITVSVVYIIVGR